MWGPSPLEERRRRFGHRHRCGDVGRHSDLRPLRGRCRLLNRDDVVARMYGRPADERIIGRSGWARFRGGLVVMARTLRVRLLVTGQRTQSRREGQYGEDQEHRDADGPQIPTHGPSIPR